MSVNQSASFFAWRRLPEQRVVQVCLDSSTAYSSIVLTAATAFGPDGALLTPKATISGHLRLQKGQKKEDK